MNNLLKEIETDDIIIYSDQVYNDELLKKSKEFLKTLVEKGEIKGCFEDESWMAYSGIKHFGLSFKINEVAYQQHIGKEFGISVQTMIDMLKCYALSCNGDYIYNTIADKISVLREFTEKYGDKNYKVHQIDKFTIVDFLAFIDTPDKQIDSIIDNIRVFEPYEKSQRKLSPIINYFAIESEINRIYSSPNIDDDTFKRWFPIFFWVNVTFTLPLRATEMLVTPANCIERKEDNTVCIRIRRTKLKKGHKTVRYSVEHDYKIFEYTIPDTQAVAVIEKYIDLTKDQNRRFLFEYQDNMTNKMMSLDAFNRLLADFTTKYLVNNHRYDFVKYATGIEEFETVTAGDSRPIAMANLLFSNAGEDICRQLADHENIVTSAGYYTNVSETIFNSSIMRVQKRLNAREEDIINDYQLSRDIAVDPETSICKSSKREADFDNVDDCIEQNHLEDCIGCKYFIPSKKYIEEYMEKTKKEADESVQKIVDFMNLASSRKGQEITLDELFLKGQTDVNRYKEGCDLQSEEVAKEWLKLKNMQTTCY